jgi:tetratricopeptide (TPR) repeat protein
LKSTVRLQNIMSSKNSRGGKAQTAATSSQLRTEVDRLIQKQWYKDAVKQAKICYKQESTPENHRLLEQAYHLRARELFRLGMRESAREVVQHLVDFGVGPSNWLGDLCRLLIALGLERKAVELQDKLGTTEAKAELLVLAADMAVVDPERAQPTSPEVTRDAALVRAALQKVASGDDSAALEALRELARSSALSEWKYFVRGLIAFYRGDPADTKANWDCLDSKRMAARIAARLGRLACAEREGSRDAESEELEKLVFGEPVIARLQQISTLVAEHDWDEIFRVIGPLRHRLARIDARLPERLTRSIIGPLIKEATDETQAEAQRLVRRFTEVAEPMALDPRWNRLWAIVWDGPHASPSGARDYWSRYIEDLATVETLAPDERALAHAMVLAHIAGLYREEALDLDLEDDDAAAFFGFLAPRRKHSAPVSVAAQRCRAAAIDCLEKSLQLAPRFRAAYQSLITLHRDWDDPANVEAAALRLLNEFPDDLETLSLLVDHNSMQDNPEAALQWVQKARQLKPLDDSLREREWTIRTDLARVYALAKRFDEGRGQFLAAEQLFPERSQHFAQRARRAIFEARAGLPKESDAHIEQAKLSLPEPAPLYLALEIEAIRYHAPKKTRENYARLWARELKKKCRSETAGEMAYLLRSLLKGGAGYPRRALHVKKLVGYLRRSIKLNYRRADIERVCAFLGVVSDGAELLEKLLDPALRSYPDSARLHFEAGAVALKQSILSKSPTAARQHLETANRLVESATGAADKSLASEIKEVLSVLNALTEGPLQALFSEDSPFARPPGRRRSRESEFDQLELPGFFDDDGDDPDWSDDGDEEGDFDITPKPRAKARGSKRR